MATRDLLERARGAPNGWKHRDVVRLLKSEGFVAFEGGHCTILRHRAFADLQVSVPRHRAVKPYILRLAVQAIDSAKARRVPDGS